MVECSHGQQKTLGLSPAQATIFHLKPTPVTVKYTQKSGNCLRASKLVTQGYLQRIKQKKHLEFDSFPMSTKTTTSGIGFISYVYLKAEQPSV